MRREEGSFGIPSENSHFSVGAERGEGDEFVGAPGLT